MADRAALVTGDLAEMKWRFRLGALFLIIGITIVILPLLQRAYGAYSQWQLEREWDEAVQKAQGQTSRELAPASVREVLGGFFSIRAAHAAPLSAPAGPHARRRSPASLANLSTSCRTPVQQSRNRRESLGLVRMEIPKLNMRAVLVDGTSNAQLARGPAHFSFTALPGQPGNCAIAGHRNMYGSWFKDLNRLRPGDQIILRTPRVAYNYRVTGSRIVLSNDSSVLRPTRDATLTLVTCMIPYARHRLVVFGQKV